MEHIFFEAQLCSEILILKEKSFFDRSEGFLNGIFHPCTLWDGGLARWKNCRCAVAVAVGVIWKMSKYEEMHSVSNMGMS